jgi:hypothetical protein
MHIRAPRGAEKRMELREFEGVEVVENLDGMRGFKQER